MKGAVFVGPDVVAWVMTAPGVKRQSLAGWVHVLHFDPVTRAKRGAIAESAAAAEKSARAMGAEFFPRGTWEASGVPVPLNKTFPAIRPGLYKRLIGAEARAGVAYA